MFELMSVKYASIHEDFSQPTNRLEEAFGSTEGMGTKINKTVYVWIYVSSIHVP